VNKKIVMRTAEEIKRDLRERFVEAVEVKAMNHQDPEWRTGMKGAFLEGHMLQQLLAWIERIVFFCWAGRGLCLQIPQQPLECGMWLRLLYWHGLRVGSPTAPDRHPNAGLISYIGSCPASIKHTSTPWPESGRGFELRQTTNRYVQN
jgi:hypothetical protein